MSNSLQPHGLYSSWNSPGQNTGVRSSSLFQGSSKPGTKPRSPALQVDSLPAEPPGKPNQSAATQQKLKKVKSIRCRRSYQPFFSMNLCYQMTLNERCEQPLSPHGMLTVSPFLVMRIPEVNHISQYKMVPKCLVFERENHQYFCIFSILIFHTNLSSCLKGNSNQQ